MITTSFVCQGGKVKLKRRRPTGPSMTTRQQWKEMNSCTPTISKATAVRSSTPPSSKLNSNYEEATGKLSVTKTETPSYEQRSGSTITAPTAGIRTTRDSRNGARSITARDICLRSAFETSSSVVYYGVPTGPLTGPIPSWEMETYIECPRCAAIEWPFSVWARRAHPNADLCSKHT